MKIIQPIMEQPLMDPGGNIRKSRQHKKVSCTNCSSTAMFDLTIEAIYIMIDTGGGGGGWDIPPTHTPTHPPPAPAPQTKLEKTITNTM